MMKRPQKENTEKNFIVWRVHPVLEKYAFIRFLFI